MTRFFQTAICLGGAFVVHSVLIQLAAGVGLFAL